jgi:hypothetical protein
VRAKQSVYGVDAINSVEEFSMLITIRAAVFALMKGLGTIGLGGVILWQVAIHSRSQNGVAYVHVMSANVEITVDDVEYHIESICESPIVCDLRPGRHMLRMHRREQVIFEEEFTLGTREEVVLTAWERPTGGPPDVTFPNGDMNTLRSVSGRDRRVP